MAFGADACLPGDLFIVAGLRDYEQDFLCSQNTLLYGYANMFDWIGRDGEIADNAGGEEARTNKGRDVRREPEGAAGDDRDSARLVRCWSDRESLVGGVKGEIGVGKSKGVKIGVEDILRRERIRILASRRHVWVM